MVSQSENPAPIAPTEFAAQIGYWTNVHAGVLAAQNELSIRNAHESELVAQKSEVAL